MLKNPKRKGSRNELKAKKILESKGYLVVKAGGSLGAFDLLAVGMQLLYMIQVKSNAPPRPAEWLRLRHVPCPSYALKEVWIFKDRQKDPVVIGVA